MQDKKKLKTEPKKKTWTKIFKLILAITVVLIALAFLLVPVFISSKKGRQIILTKINNAIEGRTDFDSLSMGWFKGIKVWNFSFNDDAGQTSIQVKQIATKPHYGSILMGNLSFGQTIIDEPKVQINLKTEQQAEALQKKVPPEQKPVLLMPPIKQIDLVVNDGSLKVTDRQDNTAELSQINSKINLRPPGRQTDFALNLTVVDKGTQSQVRTAGKINPKQTKTGWSFKGTSGEMTVEVNDLDIESLAPLFALTGIDVQAKGVVSADIDSQIKDGQIEKLTGNIKARNIDITAAELKGDRIKTTTLDIDVDLSHEAGTLNINKLHLKSDWAAVNATGAIPTTFKSFTELIKPDSAYELKTDFECDLPAVFSQMPRAFGLKEGMQITSGSLAGNIEKITEAGIQKIQGRATLSGLQGTVDGKAVSLSQPIEAQTQISSDKTGIKFDKLDVSSSFARVNCTGTTELLNFNADVDLKKFQTEFGQFANIGPYKIAGELSGKGRVSIKEDTFTAVGSSTVKNLVLASEKATASEPAADLSFDFNIDQKNNLIGIGSLIANATLGQLTVKDAVLPLNEKSAKSMNLPISANNVNLQKLQPFAVLFASFPKEMQLAGTADSDISISSKNDTYIIKTESTKIKNLKVNYPDQKPFEPNEVSLVLDAEINPQQKTIDVKKLILDSPQIKIKKGQIKQINIGDKTKLEGQFDCEYDWAAISTIAAPYLPKGLNLEGKRKDTFDFSSEYPTDQKDKLLANLNSQAKLGFDTADYKGLNFSSTELDIKIQNGLLNIAPFSTTVNNGRLNFAARIDLRQKPVVLETTGPMQIIDKVEINEQVGKNLLENLNPIFKGQTDITGIANFHCEKLAIPLGKDPDMQTEIIGTVGIENMKLQTKGLLGIIMSRTKTGKTIDAAVLPTKFVLQKGKLSYDDNMQVNLDKYPTNFFGSIGPNRILDMKVVTPYVLTKDFQFETVKIDEQTTTDRITLPLTGTIDKPKLDWDKLMEEILKQQLRQKIREGLGDLLK